MHIGPDEITFQNERYLKEVSRAQMVNLEAELICSEAQVLKRRFTISFVFKATNIVKTTSIIDLQGLHKGKQF